MKVSLKKESTALDGNHGKGFPGGVLFDVRCDFPVVIYGCESWTVRDQHWCCTRDQKSDKLEYPFSPLSTVAKIWKQPKCLSADERIKKKGCI